MTRQGWSQGQKPLRGYGSTVPTFCGCVMMQVVRCPCENDVWPLRVSDQMV